LAERSPLKRKILKGQKKSGINLRMSNMATTKFDIADYLDNEEMIATTTVAVAQHIKT
jgi:hypothetical protein